MDKRITGRVWVLGDDIDTDVIYPGKYLPIIDAEEMGKHALEGYDPEFPSKLQQGDIIVAGMSFGCGSSREQAATCLKSAGVAAIVAGSFARIFFRNAVNQGIPLIQADITDKVAEGDQITIDIVNNRVEHNSGETNFNPLDDSVVVLLEAGGLIPAVRQKLGFTD